MPVLLARGMLCKEFAERSGTDAEGFDFIDLFLRDDGAGEEESALFQAVASAEPGLVVTANHGFGWDCARLIVEGLTHAADDPSRAAAHLETLDSYQGATGTYSFSASDHNGHWRHDPTTFARLSGGRFTSVSGRA